MKLHAKRDCWLLHSEDYDYAEKQMQRFSEYHNGTAANRKQQDEREKEVSKNRDQLKTKVGALLGIVI